VTSALLFKISTNLTYAAFFDPKWWKGPPYFVPGTNSARSSQDKLDLWVNAEASRQRRYALKPIQKEVALYNKAWCEAPLHDGLPATKNIAIAELREVIVDLAKESPHDLSVRPLQVTPAQCLSHVCRMSVACLSHV
jgi:hypothetical protein